jgi:hypothetical protein
MGVMAGVAVGAAAGVGVAWVLVMNEFGSGESGHDEGWRIAPPAYLALNRRKTGSQVLPDRTIVAR